LVPQIAERQVSLSKSIDTVIYTPGKLTGRPLTLPILPAGTRDLRSDERTELAQLASRSLGAMLKYASTGQGAQRIAVLAIALELLAEQTESAVTLKELVEYLREEDSDLINRLGALDIRLVSKVTQDLEALLINRAKLFTSEGIPLSADELLGRNSESGKTRFSVVCPKFVGETPEIQFFVAQLLIEFERWSSKHPSNKLQAVLMLDEADIYLPATSKPASKEPLESLLKRGRSAGLGIILATQNVSAPRYAPSIFRMESSSYCHL
jgi:DNA helicase HerA-like ATPase